MEKGEALVFPALRLDGSGQELVPFRVGGVDVAHRLSEPLVVLGVLLLDGALLVGRHHRDAGVQRGSVSSVCGQN